MNTLLNYCRTMLFAMALTLLYAAPGHAQSQTQAIKMGSMSWGNLHAPSLITKKFLEKHDYDVGLTMFSEWGIAFAALSRGDIDLLVAGPDGFTSDYWARYKNRLERVSVVNHGLFQGLVVPSWMDIDSVEQLNSVADQVRGRIIGVEPGTGLMREAAAALKAYDLQYQLIDGSTPAMVAQLKSALERREPIVTMLWTPSWMIQSFDVKFLKDPKGMFAPPQSIYWVGRKGFFDNNARARELVATVYVPLAEVVDMMTAMNDGKTIEQAVDGWWDNHQALVEKWSVIGDK